jgi:hypothetical protein
VLVHARQLRGERHHVLLQLAYGRSGHLERLPGPARLRLQIIEALFHANHAFKKPIDLAARRQIHRA